MPVRERVGHARIIGESSAHQQVQIGQIVGRLNALRVSPSPPRLSSPVRRRGASALSRVVERPGECSPDSHAVPQGPTTSTSPAPVLRLGDVGIVRCAAAAAAFLSRCGNRAGTVHAFHFLDPLVRPDSSADARVPGSRGPRPRSRTEHPAGAIFWFDVLWKVQQRAFITPRSPLKGARRAFENATLTGSARRCVTTRWGSSWWACRSGCRHAQTCSVVRTPGANRLGLSNSEGCPAAPAVLRVSRSGRPRTDSRLR
jgi:hypothetical protein